MNYKLGSFYPNKETKFLEFKEYCFKLAPSLEFTREQIINYVQGNWDSYLDNFNNQNLKIYFDYYIPKYLSCFGNSKINGKLIIGIDDNEEVTCIPSLSLNKKTLETYVISSISKYIKTDEDISKSIDVNLIEVKKKDSIISDEIDILLKEYYHSVKKYKNELKEYKILRQIWKVQIDKYSAKLVTYLNKRDLRDEFCKYLEKKNNDIDLTNIITLLKSDKFIEYPKTDIFLERKKKKDDIFYWLVKFKDMHIDIIKRNKKPKKPKFICNIDPEMILMKLSYMRNKLFNKVKYYIIEINYNCCLFKNPVFFKFPNKKKWIKRKRIGITNESGPGCI